MVRFSKRFKSFEDWYDSISKRKVSPYSRKIVAGHIRDPDANLKELKRGWRLVPVRGVPFRGKKKYRLIASELPDRWIPRGLWRFAAGITCNVDEARLLPDPVLGVHPIPVSRKYYGLLIVLWSKREEKELRDKAVARLRVMLEEFIGYPEEEWWFSFSYGEGWQVVPSKKGLLGTWEGYVEDQDLRKVKTWQGEVTEL